MKVFLTIVLSLVAIVSTNAQITIIIPDIVGSVGETLTVSIEIDNPNQDTIDAFSFGLEIDTSAIVIRNEVNKSALLDSFTVFHNLANTDSLFISGASSKGFTQSGVLLEFDIIANKNLDNFPITELRALINEGNPKVEVQLGSIIITSNEEFFETPNDAVLHQNYPNPFNPTTSISYDLPEASVVNMSVFDITGRLVQTLQNGRKPAGSYTINFDASNLSSGIYFYRITAEDFIQTRTMTLIK
ncbi:MAG: T9SS type A sorting domain-containing protein [Balneola sp.]|jgi:hypothetical protein